MIGLNEQFVDAAFVVAVVIVAAHSKYHANEI